MHLYLLRLTLLVLVILIAACGEEGDETPNMPIESTCAIADEINQINSRDFKMGFSTWSFGPGIQDVEDTYDFVLGNGDIYSEQVDGKIPWDALINGTPMPESYVDNINYRVSKRVRNLDLILSVSLLNLGRDGLIEDWDTDISPNNRLNDPIIENAYYAHLRYLIQRLDPNYLVIAMETNELLVKSPSKWEEYKLLMANIRSKLKQEFPNLPLSESITLHNYLNPDAIDKGEFIREVSNYISQLDFAAISFYPFLKGQSKTSDFQVAFDFLHQEVDIPIAFVETNHIAEDLVVNTFNLNIPSDQCEQKEYLETLIINAQDNDYQFIIWWAHRDYDRLWDTFPDDVKDIGKLWKDTGLINEDGAEKEALMVWNRVLSI